jgi:hypothetical protein
MVEQTTLLDSGATENFIDKKTWQHLGIGRQPLSTPVKLRNVDGTENKLGLITHFCWLRIKYNGHSKLQRFFITALGKDRMILGYPFLWEFEPLIDWRKGDLKHGDVILQSSNYKFIPLYIRKVKNTQALGQPPPHLPKPIVAYLRRTNFAQQWA